MPTVTADLLDQSASIPTPQVLYPQTVTVPQIDQHGFAQAPNTTRTLTFGIIDQSPVLFAPGGSGNLAQKVDFGGAFQSNAFQANAFQSSGISLDRSAVTFAPNVAITITAPGPARTGEAFQADAFQANAFQVGTSTGLDQSAVALAPATISQQSGTTQTVFAGVIDQHGLAIAPGLPVRISPGLINQSAVTFAPGQGNIVAFGGDVSWDSPNVTWDDLGVVWDAGGSGSGVLNNQATTFAPSAQFKPAFGLIDNSAVMFAPQVGSKAVAAPLIDRSAILFAPQSKLSVTFDLVDNSPSLFAPQTGVLAYPLIDQSATVFAPQVNPAEVDLPLIDQTPIILVFDVTQKISGFALIDQHGFAFAPFVGKVVILDLIDQSAVTFIPSLTPVLLDLIDQHGFAIAPERVILPSGQSVRLDDDPSQFLDASAVALSPDVQVAPPRNVTMQLLDGSGQVLAPVVVKTIIPLTPVHFRNRPVIRRHVDQPVVIPVDVEDPKVPS